MPTLKWISTYDFYVMERKIWRTIKLNSNPENSLGIRSFNLQKTLT